MDGNSRGEPIKKHLRYTHIAYIIKLITGSWPDNHINSLATFPKLNHNKCMQRNIFYYLEGIREKTRQSAQRKEME